MQKLFILVMRLRGSMLTADFFASWGAGDTLWYKGCSLQLTWVQVHVILICDLVVDDYMIIIIIIIIIIISFMQVIYTYIPETNQVPREYSVSAILPLLFMVPISLVPVLALLYFYVSTFRRMYAVPNMAVFYSSFTSWFPGMLLMYFLNDFEMVPVAPIITGITLVFTFHMHCISVVRALYFKIFSASFLITFLSP